MMIGRASLFGVLLLGGSLPCEAQVLSLTPANVIGGSPVFFDEVYNVGAYAAGNIFNQQTGPVDMSSQVFNAWFPAELHGTANRFVTIDLGAPTVLSGIEIFNSNQNDRGTANFSLAGSSSVAAGADDTGHSGHPLPVGSVLSSPVSLLGPTALTYSTANPVNGQFFAISDATPYRYLELLLIDGQSQAALANVGLAEVKLYAVPEPSTYGAVFAVSALAFGVWRRRK